MLENLGRLIIRVFVFAMALFPAPLCPGAVASADAGAKDLVKPAAAAWDSLAAAMRNVSGRVDWIKDLRSNNPAEYQDYWASEKVEFWVTEHEGKVSADAYSKAGKWLQQSVYCYNGDYAFAATRREREGPFTLTVYSRGDNMMARRLMSSVRRHIPQLHSPYDIEGDTRTLSHIVVSPDFSLTSSRDVQEAGRSLKELVFTFAPSADFAPYDRSTRYCQLLVEPSAKWRIVRSELRDATWDTIVTIDYAVSSDEPAQLTDVEVVSKTKDGTVDNYHIKYGDLLFHITQASEFRLTAVGMNEILPPVRRRLPFLWLIGGTLLLVGIILAFLARQARRRLSKSS